MSGLTRKDIQEAMQQLDLFLMVAYQQYDTLAQSVSPIDEKVQELQQDWKPRQIEFWQELLNTDIPAISEALISCLTLFRKEARSASQIALPPLMRLRLYGSDLRAISMEVEECGILLTSYLICFNDREIEQQIRDRQRILHALEKLSQVVKEGIHKERAALERAPKDQQELLCPFVSRGVGMRNIPRVTIHQEGQQ